MFSLEFDESSLISVRMQRDYGWPAFLDELARLERLALGRIVHGRVRGMPTGFEDLDRLTGGLHESELCILAARPGIGMTSLAINIALYSAVEAGTPTLIVTLNNSPTEIAMRMLCSLASVGVAECRSGMLSKEDHQRLLGVSTRVNASPLYIDPRRNSSDIRASARRLKVTQDLRLVVIDYLQLIQPDDLRDRRRRNLRKTVFRLKNLAQELKVAVLCLVRMSSVEASFPPRLATAVDEQADLVLLAQRGDVPHAREVFVAKQRSGPTGKLTLAYSERFGRFDNMAPGPHEG